MLLALRAQHQNTPSLLPRPSRPAQSMNVRLPPLGAPVLNHVRHVRIIHAPRRNVGGEQYPLAKLTKPVRRHGTILLRFLRMDFHHRDAVDAIENVREELTRVGRGEEDDHLVIVGVLDVGYVLEEVDQAGNPSTAVSSIGGCGKGDEGLIHLFVRVRGGIHISHAIHGEIIGPHVAGHDGSQIFGDGRREEQRLRRTLCRQFPLSALHGQLLEMTPHSQNVFHVLPEPHVQTSIGLVQHDDADVADDFGEGRAAHVAVFHVIDQPSRRGHEDEGQVLLEAAEVDVAAAPAVHDLGGHAMPLAGFLSVVIAIQSIGVRGREDLRLRVNLHGQFARGTQYQCGDAPPHPLLRLLSHPIIVAATPAAVGSRLIRTGDTPAPQRILNGRQ
mmetsp:Transcript_23592/g.40275  ORF Transcript_23592/g.40275 Transcript_23592/m.40275 type:complete len:387 (-) Transcript_23592:578-1738(-)